jgi:predicted transposase/invertase (TIGR01784 family)
MKAKYVNPFTDFGFKKIFGEEASKPLLIDFLNSLLPKIHIKNLRFKDKNKNGRSAEERQAIYDIYCENENGEKIIIELQKAKLNYFKDRTIYYSTFPIQEQAEKGEWNYELQAVFCIGILDFEFNKDANKEVIHTAILKDQNNRVFYDKLTFVYLEMPHFTKKEHELETRLDKCLYFIKHLEDFQSIPEIFKDKIFVDAFKKAEIAKYSPEEREAYEQSLKTFRDNKAVMDYALDTSFDEGKKKGKIEEKMEIIDKGIEMGLKLEQLSILTGISIEEIKKYLKNKKE